MISNFRVLFSKTFYIVRSQECSVFSSFANSFIFWHTVGVQLCILCKEGIQFYFSSYCQPVFLITFNNLFFPHRFVRPLSPNRAPWIFSVFQSCFPNLFILVLLPYCCFITLALQYDLTYNEFFKTDLAIYTTVFFLISFGNQVAKKKKNPIIIYIAIALNLEINQGEIAIFTIRFSSMNIVFSQLHLFTSS